MADRCSVCRYPDRVAIDTALAVGEPVRVVAARFSLGKSAVGVHKVRHIPRAVHAALQRAGREDGLLQTFDGLLADVQRIKVRAERAGDLGIALAAVNQLCKLFETAARLQPPPPVPATGKHAPRVRLVFTQMGPETVIEEGPILDVTLAEPARQEPAPEPAEAAQKAEPQLQTTAPDPQSPVEPPNRYSAQARSDRERAAEEAADRESNRQGREAKRGKSWGFF